MTKEEDQQLIRATLAGDSSAFEKLVGRHQDVIFSCALRMVGDYDDARDIAQTVFVKVYENLSSYDPKYKFFSWIYRIMMNEVVNIQHRRKRHQALDPATKAPTRDPDRHLAIGELTRLIESALQELTIDYRVPLVMRHFAELSYREISFVLDVEEKTVKSRLFTARRLLCEILRKRGVEAYDAQ